MRRIAEVTDGKSQIPFATELESGKWLHDSDMCVHMPHTCALKLDNNDVITPWKTGISKSLCQQ